MILTRVTGVFGYKYFCKDKMLGVNFVGYLKFNKQPN